ncbi:rhamnogalacturonan acetylesterase [Fodinibius salsisoli]|uniref:Rhamnogalacturonan acetylesterase n=1 Tax=Fodinibius salsisoli TaxID=2820877 RepID=A0ABT3PKX2_9BACT|nr:rhamnogalacturonan acetylesterase [Fodinibius salsisoli]MCW9706591.1 rhamnogalacturonan acetylesterase [Fodinibius salsisoli]
MRNKYSYLLTFILLIGLTSIAAVPPSDTVTVYLIGDSTMSDKAVEAYPETGWGMPFQYYFDDEIVVENHARNGRSTRTFLEEGRWKPIVNQLSKGDYVFIQFGHNDEVLSKEQSTTPQQFQANLAQYVTETRGRGAQPVLLSPTARRHFDENGKLLDTHQQYSDLAEDVAVKLEVPFLDIDSQSQQLLRELGPDDSRFLYNHLEPGENPHYPDGREDNTHFNEYGARKMAQLVLHGIEELGLDLAAHIDNQ